jgi:hypothetical protein
MEADHARLTRRRFLALAAGGVGAAVLVSARTARAAPARAPKRADDGVARLGRGYLRRHPHEADATFLRAQLRGIDTDTNVRPQLPKLATAAADDFAGMEVVNVDGWYLARSEARAAAAIALGA